MKSPDMPILTYAKPERVFLKGHAEYGEKWVQERIAEDPSILGLGDLVLKVLTAVDSRTNPASTAGTAQHDLDLVSG